MTEPIEQDDENSSEDSHPRFHLIWDVIVLQFKLGIDGFRDLVLVPVSLVAALMGLVAGGDQPAQYLQRVLKFGRRTEHWINLFGYRRNGGTSDEMIKPIRDKVFEEAGNTPWLQKAGVQLNKSLDTVGKAIKTPENDDSIDKK